jgi:hypothetical protein
MALTDEVLARGAVESERSSQPGVSHATAPDAPDFFRLVIALTDSVANGAPGDASGATRASAGPDRTDAQYSDAAVFETLKGWVAFAYIKPHHTDPNDGFGWPFAVDGATIVVGAILETSSEHGIGGIGTSNETQSSVRRTCSGEMISAAVRCMDLSALFRLVRGP